MRRPTIVACGALFCAALALFIAPINSDPEFGPAPEIVQPTAEAPFRADPLQEFALIEDRPLFARDRRKGSPAAFVDSGRKPAPSEPDLEAVLHGVLDYSRGKKALIAADAKAAPIWLALHDSLGGWTIMEIRKDAVEFESGERRKTIPLYAFSANLAEGTPVNREIANIAPQESSSTNKE